MKLVDFVVLGIIGITVLFSILKTPFIIIFFSFITLKPALNKSNFL